MLQTTLVGQVYTVLDKYTRAHRMANPAPGNSEIVAAWDQEFTGFRKELEQGLTTLSQGKVVHQSMDLPMEKGHTYTGLGIRNKAGGATGKLGGMVGRKGSAPAVPTTKPSFSRQGSSNSGQLALTNGRELDEWWNDADAVVARRDCLLNTCAVTAVPGETSSGKSRLVRELGHGGALMVRIGARVPAAAVDAFERARYAGRVPALAAA